MATGTPNTEGLYNIQVFNAKTETNDNPLLTGTFRGTNAKQALDHFFQDDPSLRDRRKDLENQRLRVEVTSMSRSTREPSGEVVIADQTEDRRTYYGTFSKFFEVENQ